MKNIPALLLNEQLKRKYAKEEVQKAIESIRQYGPLAGLSSRTMYEYKSLTTFMKEEITSEPSSEEEMVGSTA